MAAGRYRAAVEKGVRAAALFRKSHDSAGEGRALTETGLARLYSGEYQAALGDFTTALDLARQTGDVSAEVTRLNNIGTVFYFQGRYADAMDRYQAAMRTVTAAPNQPWSASRRQLTTGNIAMLYQTLGNYQRALDLYTELLQGRQALPPQEQAQLLSNVGALRRRLGDPLKAVDTYRAAQALYARTAHRDGEVAVLNNIGIVQAMDLRDFATAVGTFTTSLGLAEAAGDRPLAIHAHLYRGEALYRTGDMRRSEADFEIAAHDAETLGETEENWKALYGLARVAMARGDDGRADRLLGRAITLIESLRAGLGDASLKSDFLADKRDVYDSLIEKTVNARDAFRLMEQSRARNLQDRIAAAAAPDLREFSKGLPAGTAVLEYWLGRASAAVLWITAKGSGIKHWTMSSEDFQRMTALPAALADPQRRDWREAANRVGAELLSAPALRDGTIKHLIVIPDGVLGRLPFEVLPVDNTKLLIQRFTVAYSPTARLVAERTRKRVIRWPWQKMMEAYADPTSGRQPDGEELASARAWIALPEAAREVNGIARLLGGRSAQHVGRDARKEYLAAARGVSVLHFATHAFADPQDPDRSYILFAPASASQHYDYLFMKEASSLPLAGVDLATLSACETEAGKVVGGEGVQSFSRAFLAAGARSVLTSLWAVGDRSTAELMLRFYGGLSRGESSAEALRTAKLTFLKDQHYCHPAYWAAFVLNGDANVQLPYVIGWMWIAAPAAVLLGLAALLKKRAKKA